MKKEKGWRDKLAQGKSRRENEKREEYSKREMAKEIEGGSTNREIDNLYFIDR